jgi:hypothetical protein
MMSELKMEVSLDNDKMALRDSLDDLMDVQLIDNTPREAQTARGELVAILHRLEKSTWQAAQQSQRESYVAKLKDKLAHAEIICERLSRSHGRVSSFQHSDGVREALEWAIQACLGEEEGE